METAEVLSNADDSTSAQRVSGAAVERDGLAGRPGAAHVIGDGQLAWRPAVVAGHTVTVPAEWVRRDDVTAVVTEDTPGDRCRRARGAR